MLKKKSPNNPERNLLNKQSNLNYGLHVVINLDNYYRPELYQFFNTFSAMFVIMLVSVMLTKNQHYIMCNTKPSGTGSHEKNTSRDLVKCTLLI